MGGYDENYTAKSTVFSIDTAALDPFSAVTEHAPMMAERGDLSIAINEELGMAVVAGGYTHSDEFCDPIATSEWYSITSDAWFNASVLRYPRADMALAFVKGELYGFGGERQAEGFCDLVTQPGPADRFVPVTEIELLDKDSGEWKVVAEMEYHRYRFSSVVTQDEIIIFGGQEAFSKLCECFATKNFVAVYRKREPTVAPTGRPSAEPSTLSPTTIPTERPSLAPEANFPTAIPTEAPSDSSSGVSLCTEHRRLFLTVFVTAMALVIF